MVHASVARLFKDKIKGYSLHVQQPAIRVCTQAQQLIRYPHNLFTKTYFNITLRVTSFLFYYGFVARK